MVVPMRMPVARGVALDMVMMLGAGRDGNHAENVIL
jgi:hypothetical protein